MEYLTVKELKVALQEVPDDAMIVMNVKHDSNVRRIVLDSSKEIVLLID